MWSTPVPLLYGRAKCTLIEIALAPPALVYSTSTHNLGQGSVRETLKGYVLICSSDFEGTNLIQGRAKEQICS